MAASAVRAVRSWLFVPGGRPERFAKADASGAGAVILDLEDGVDPASRVAAREHVAAWLAGGHRGWVRVNDVRSADFVADAQALVGCDRAALVGVVLAKAESAADVATVHGAIGSDVPVLALIESASGVERASEIAAADGVHTLALGVADLRLDAVIGDDPLAWVYPRSRLVFAARAAGLASPVDGPTMRLDDMRLVAAEARQARGLGFGGKLCVHPKQVAEVDAAFGYSEAERDWARRVLQSAGDVDDVGAVRIDGEMIDRPSMMLARAIAASNEPFERAGRDDCRP